MKKLNVSFKAKIVIGFLIVALLVAAAGALGINNQMDMARRNQAMYEDSIKPLMMVSNASQLCQKSRIALGNAVLGNDGLHRMKQVEELNVQLQSLKTQLQMLSDQFGGEEYEIVSTVMQSAEAYEAAFGNSTELAKLGAVAASDLLLEADTLAANIQSGLMSLEVRLNNRAIENYNLANASTQRAKVYLVALIAVGVVLSVIMGISIARMIIKPIREASAQLEKVAAGDMQGDMNAAIFKSEFKVIGSDLQRVRGSLNLLLEQVQHLSNAAIEGRLSERADTQELRGEYREIVEGINHTLDAIIAPITTATDVMNIMSDGEYNISVEGDFQGDHAIIKNALNSSIDTINRCFGEINAVLNKIAQGDMRTGITSQFPGNFVKIQQAINAIITSLNGVLSDIAGASEQVASGSKQVSDSSQTISNGANTQACALEQLTASITQIAEQTKQNAVNANKANELSISAREDALTGNERMKGMQIAMTEIDDASRSISKVIKVIDDIAFQTNILALNAAVEAARAGMHGKGFAVVAEEVRNLAIRSAKAAQETTELIERSIKKTSAGTKIADETALALTNIVNSVERAVELVGDIAKASNEQAAAIAQIDNGITQMSEIVQTNSAISEETAAAATELSDLAELLKEKVGQFKLQSYEI